MQGIIIATSGRETNCTSHTLENVLFPLSPSCAFEKKIAKHQKESVKELEISQSWSLQANLHLN